MKICFNISHVLNSYYWFKTNFGVPGGTDTSKLEIAQFQITFSSLRLHGCVRNCSAEMLKIFILHKFKYIIVVPRM